MMITRCGWCDNELDANTATMEHDEYGAVCITHDELVGSEFYGDPDAAYEIALDGLLGVG